ncbi:hypothetical protein [Sphingobium yanoikuyae]|jgi:hypothetical protein|uniref:hypothetical protein n=1 Tax=Sphingobium TaxID=165695 RepID=UPI0028B18496|nr:hypothetical protein [Sphingobium yanoikuyae]
MNDAIAQLNTLASLNSHLTAVINNIKSEDYKDDEDETIWQTWGHEQWRLFYKLLATLLAMGERDLAEGWYNRSEIHYDTTFEEWLRDSLPHYLELIGAGGSA